jgi:SPP1 gp7 family putative phage head morphogenesis protein
LAKQIYESRTNPNFNPDLLKATAKKLTEAVQKGYGKDFLNVDWDTPDSAMITKLQASVWQFSAAKNYQELNDISRAMLGEDGNLLEFSDFKEKVKSLNYKYNKDWLETEYDSAISSATAAARWTEFEKNADIMPMLKYQTSGDDKVRADHKLLEGTTKPINDTFWKTYYPPNGWRCRCEAIQLPESSSAPVEPKGLPNVPQMFRTNMAQNGVIFPKGHPYYKGVPKDVLRRSMQYIPPEYAFIPKEGYGEHAMVQYEPEAKENREIAEMLAKEGYKDIKLMPRLHEKETELREKLYGKEYAEQHPTKCPDCFADGKPIEFKGAVRKKMSKRNIYCNIQFFLQHE